MHYQSVLNTTTKATTQTIIPQSTSLLPWSFHTMMPCHCWPSRSITTHTGTVITIFSGNNLLNTRRLWSAIRLTMIRHRLHLLCTIKAAVATTALPVNRCICRRLRHIIKQRRFIGCNYRI